MPCITVAPRLRTVAIAFDPSVISHDCSWSMSRAPCRVQFLCARDPIARESDVFLVGLHHLAMMPRRLVAIPSTPSMLPSSDTSVSQSSTSVSFSRTDRWSSLLVWCSFGHHRLRPPRGGRPNLASQVREGIMRFVPLRFRLHDPGSSVFFRVGTLGTAG